MTPTITVAAAAARIASDCSHHHRSQGQCQAGFGLEAVRLWASRITRAANPSGTGGVLNAVHNPATPCSCVSASRQAGQSDK